MTIHRFISQALFVLPMVVFFGLFLQSNASANASKDAITIYPDDTTLTHVQQLIFEFDRPVTYVGGIPTAEQLAFVDVIKGGAISGVNNGSNTGLSSDKKKKAPASEKWLPQCHWRFIDTKRLACELDKPLLPGSIYHLVVNQGFSGLDDWQLDNTVKHTIRTPFPVDLFSNAYADPDLYYAWPKMSLSASAQKGDNDWLRGFLTQAMKVRKPDGEVVDVKASFNDEQPYIPLTIESKNTDFAQDGRYELFIPKGTEFEFADYVNDEPILLYHHEFYQDFKLLGARCFYQHSLDLPYATQQEASDHQPQWRLDKLDNCQPEQFELAFSRSINAREQLDPLLDNEKFASVRTENMQNGRFIYRFELGESRRYRWDLTSLVTRNKQGYSGQQFVELTTTKSWPRWHFERLKPITPLDLNTPLLAANTIKALAGEVTTIDSSQKLHAWLNGEKLQAQEYVWPMVYSDDYRWQKGAMQTLDFKQFLPTNSGILNLDFSIQGVDGEQAQRQANLIKVDAFNMQLLRADDWLIQITDWQNGEPVVGVNISMVCADESLSRYLGQTNDLGVVNVPAHSYADSCWLWAEHSLGVAGLRLSGANSLSGDNHANQAAIRAWSGQPVYEPGKTINFGVIGKTRTESGLKASVDWGGKQLYFGRFRTAQNDDLPVTLPTFSTFGMASVAIDTEQHWPVGSYFLKLYNKDNTNDTSDINILGSVEIEYYETPEFEVFFNGSQQMNYGDSFDWSLEAKRLNGVALADAKVEVEYQVNEIGATPFWPRGYSWLTKDLHNSLAIKFPVVNTKLDANGMVNGKTAQINRQSGLLAINAVASVTAKDGEVQSHQTMGYYFGDEYYFGVKVNTEQQSIELVVIDKDGELLVNDADLPEIISQAFTKVKAKASQGIVVNIQQNRRGQTPRTVTCLLSSLQDSCQLKGLEYRLEVSVSIDNEILAKGNIYVSKHYVRQSQEPLAFAEQTVNVSANDKSVDLTLNAQVAGRALISVSTDKIESYFYQDIRKGSNHFTLPLKRQYMPQVTVEAMMTIADHQLSDRQKKRGDRSVQSKVVIGLQQPQNLQVAVQTAQGELLSGAPVEVSFNANQLVDSQTWLVNEGLWQLLGLDEQTYQLPRVLELLEANRYSTFWAGAERYVDYYTGGRVLGRFNGALAKPESMSESGIAVHSASGDVAPSEAKSAQFVDSLWFSPMALKVDEPQSLQFDLPKVPGRYKLVTVAVNDDEFDLDVQTIVTYLPQEYFVDAPKQMVQSDKAQLLITAINRTDKPLNETLRLTLDGKPWRDLEVKGNANSQQVISVDIKRLSQGEHVLGVWHDDFGQVGQRIIKVKADVIEVKRQFILGGEDGQNMLLPSDYVSGSLSFSGRSMKALAPSWDTHLQSLQYYPYQCWEQNISRAVSYAYSPIAAKQWPQGEQVFERLLKGASRYRQGGGFGYFAAFEPDNFLTAYSHLVGSWLEERSDEGRLYEIGDLNKVVSKLRLSEKVSDILANGDNTQRSMALLALAKTGELDKAQVLEQRSNIGASNGFAQVLQVLALRHVNADDKLINNAIKDILRRGYQDAGVSILSDNAERCFAYMAFGQSHPRAEKLLEQVLAEQWQNGDFGSTFASAACSVAFKDKLSQSSPLKPLKHEVEGQLAMFDLVGGNRSQVVMTYQQAIDKQPAYSRGIKLKQQYYIATDTDNWHELKNPQDKWRLMPDNHTLKIGDLVRVVMTVDSPIRREHVVINSPIAGTFEVNNTKFEHSVSGLFGGSGMSHMSMNMSVGRSIGGGMVRPPDRPIMPMVEQQIELDRVLLFPYWLQAGKTKFSYLMKVRHAGKFIAPGAKVEMMYQPDVAAQTTGRYFSVAGY